MSDNSRPSWSKLSTAINSSMSIDEILSASKADYDVILSPVQVENLINGKFYTVKDRFVTGRVDMDTGDLVNWEVVKGRYEVVPNSTIAAKAKALHRLAESNNIPSELDYAGILDGGRRFFLTIRMPDLRIQAGNFMNHIVVLTSHDGSSPITYYHVNSRSATNTIYRIGGDFNNHLKKKHTPSTEMWKSEHAEVLNSYIKWQDEFSVQMERARNVDLSGSDLLNVLNRVWPDIDADTVRKQKHREDVMSTVVKLYNAEYNSGTIGKNGASLFSAICDYYDNYRNVSVIDSAQQALELDNFVNRQKVSAFKDIINYGKK